jgi:hypothetical protein
VADTGGLFPIHKAAQMNKTALDIPTRNNPAKPDIA